MSQNDSRLFDFQSISTEDIREIFLKYNKETLIQHINPVISGMSTSNYIVEARDKKYLLKIYPENNDHSNIEIGAYKNAHKIIKVPEVLHFDDSKIIIDNTYAIFQYIDGFKRKIIQFQHQYEYFLNGIPGTYLKEIVKNDLKDFINTNNQLIQRICKTNVLCHGDFIPSNILIDLNDTPWFIDFEYSFSAPPYYDIGKLFRNRDNYSQYIDDNMKNNFARGYNAMSLRKLPEDWYKLSKIADIAVMLALVNRENVPPQWIEEIEEEIVETMNLVKSTLELN